MCFSAVVYMSNVFYVMKPNRYENCRFCISDQFSDDCEKFILMSPKPISIVENGFESRDDIILLLCKIQENYYKLDYLRKWEYF